MPRGIRKVAVEPTPEEIVGAEDAVEIEDDAVVHVSGFPAGTVEVVVEFADETVCRRYSLKEHGKAFCALAEGFVAKFNAPGEGGYKHKLGGKRIGDYFEAVAKGGYEGNLQRVLKLEKEGKEIADVLEINHQGGRPLRLVPLKKGDTYNAKKYPLPSHVIEKFFVERA